MYGIDKCTVCGGAKAETLKMCIPCLEKYSPPAHLIKAMLAGVPAESDGVKYGCISAYILRTRASHTKSLRGTYITQVELMSGKSHSITVADPQRIKILSE